MQSWSKRTFTLAVVLVSLHSFERGGTSDELMGELGAVLWIGVVEVLELAVAASLVRVVVCRKKERHC
jgi:hypothetical protein